MVETAAVGTVLRADEPVQTARAEPPLVVGTVAQDAEPLDLFSLDLRPGATQGAELQLTHPVTGNPTGVFLTVMGSDSPAYRDAMRGVRDRVSAAPKSEPKDEESLLILRLARSAACAVKAWRTGDVKTVKFNGQDLKFSVDNAIVVMRHASWIIDQVNAFHSDRANFFKP